MARVRQKVVLIKCNIMDVNLFVLCIKDSCGKAISGWIAKEVIVRGCLELHKKR